MDKFPFPGEIEMLQTVKQNVVKHVLKNPTPTSQTMARQCLDHLDATGLFLQQLGYFIATQPDAVEAAAGKAAGEGKILQFPGEKNGAKAT